LKNVTRSFLQRPLLQVDALMGRVGELEQCKGRLRQLMDERALHKKEAAFYQSMAWPVQFEARVIKNRSEMQDLRMLISRLEVVVGAEKQGMSNEEVR
jgi:hypothetical protein